MSDLEAQKTLLSAGAGAPSYGAADDALPDTDPKLGLTSDQVKANLEKYGPNELEDGGKDSFLMILLTQCMSVIFLLTTTAALIVHLTAKTSEDEFKAKFLVTLVIGVCLMNTIGEYSGQDAGAALRAKDPEKCGVIRDGAKCEIPASELVPGDILLVNLGDMVPADVRVLEAVDLQTNEAALTGEPTEVNKTVEPKEGETAFPTNMLYKLTCVVSGSGKGQVTTTGMHTEVGLIAKRLKGTGSKPLCPLQKTVNALGRLIGIGCGCMIVFGMVSSHLMGYSGFPPKCPPDDDACANLDNMVRGLLMAVTLIPHGLPLVVMVMLRVGSQLMAEKNAFVTRQSAVDYLGAINVICTDKTGTLTEGKMAVKTFISIVKGAPDDRIELGFYPLKGLNPKGRIFNAVDLTPARRKEFDEGKAAKDIDGIEDLGDFRVEAKGAPACLAQAMAACSSINTWATTIQFNNADGAWEAVGNMSDGAIRVAAWKGHYAEDSPEGKDLVAKHTREEKLEVPFTSARKMSASIHELPSSKCCATLKFGANDTHFAIIKGAPDRVLKAAKELRALELTDGDKKLSVASQALSADENQKISKENDMLANQALRSLLITVRPLSASDMTKIRAMESAQDTLEFLLSPGPLGYLGLFGIFDPPRTSVPPSVAQCHEAGIRVVMITGDQRPTALAIGKLVGIINQDEDKKARTCTDLHADPSAAPKPKKEDSSSKLKRGMSVHLDEGEKKHQAEKDFKDEEEIHAMTRETNIWARAQPTDKVCVVDSLVAQEQISAMTGDGVNDAPALKRADVGVSMGIAGTAVTKNSADMVLMDDNFSTIVGAIHEGRKIYGNVQKYVLFNLSMKASECFCLILAIFLNLPAPIGGIQQLVNMVCTHIIPPMSLAYEVSEEYTMLVKPRKTQGDLILNSALVFNRWIPYVLCYGVIIITGETINIWMHTGHAQIDALLPTSFEGKGGNANIACQSAGILGDNDAFIIDPLPYHCMCTVSALVSPSGGRETRDQWGTSDASSVPYDLYSGDTGDAFDVANTPWKGGESSLVKPCVAGNGETHMCWKTATGDHPMLPSFNCAAWGEKLGQSTTFAAVMIGEVSSLVTFRTDGPFWSARWSWSFFGCWCFNITMYIMVNTVPAVTEKLSLAPLDMTHLAIALITPVLLVSCSEVIKVNYRMKLRMQHADEGVHYGGEDSKKGEEV